MEASFICIDEFVAFDLFVDLKTYEGLSIRDVFPIFEV